uniref:Coiled-coil domain containing 192 n=1 Tax=Aotus nancymaae TaxID=37293 RepID=A0A2K5CJH7_AOTNA
MMPVDISPRDRGSQRAWLEMGQCHSKISVFSESVTPERSSMTSGSLESDTQENKISLMSLDTGQMAFTLAQLESLEICLKAAEEKAKALSEQLSVSEGTKSKLLEQVSRLEEKLEAVNHKEASEETYKKMVLVKDQKLKHKKKVKKLQTDLATAKQEAAITIRELNEKINTLCEGKPAPREDRLLEEFCGGLPPVEKSDRKISLIMELSTQVSLQTERITQPQEILEEKERKIQQLEAEWSAQPSQENL